MNKGLAQDHISFEYYDSDYPSNYFGPYPENFDDTTEFQGIADDVPRYIQVASETGGPILELCCGSGRIGIPLAREGYEVTGIDLFPAMLDQFNANLLGEDPGTANNITLYQGDATQLDLQEKGFALIIIGFNSLLAIPQLESQIEVLHCARDHLRPSGRLVIDVANPFGLNLDGDATPKAFFSRRNVRTGNYYTRFAMMRPMDDAQRQELYGWYDEVQSDDALIRRYYSMTWRPIFRSELELMLRHAGFDILSMEGDHHGGKFSTAGPSIFAQAVPSGLG